MADLPFQLPGSRADRLRTAADVEGKIARGLDALGPLAGRDIALLDVQAGPLRDRIAGRASSVIDVPPEDPLRLDTPDGSLDAVVSLWSGFRGVRAADLAEVDRVLRAGGRLLVVHDYGRDDVSALRDPASPEYGEWSRRDGPFLHGAGFKIRVLHCFWTFASLDDARSFLADAFGAPGEAIAAALKRPRLSWNVAVYHRWRGGSAPDDAALGASADGSAGDAATRR